MRSAARERLSAYGCFPIIGGRNAFLRFELLGEMCISFVTAQLRYLRNRVFCTAEKLFGFLQTKINQFLKNAFSVISLIHSLQIASADIRAFAQFLYIPIEFRMLLHFFTNLKQLLIKLKIFRFLHVVCILRLEFSFFFRLIERKAQITDKCAVFRLITAGEFAKRQ